MRKAVKVSVAVILISAVCHAQVSLWGYALSNHFIISSFYENNAFFFKNPYWGSGFQLNMAPDSVDDQFQGCETNTFNLIRDKILPEEFISNAGFANVWGSQESSTDLYKRIIKVYTSYYYADFNSAVSSGRRNYFSSFPYKAMHFLLTRATQMYRVKKCVDVFRRTTVSFNTNVRGYEMRFGRFASSSFKMNLNMFGTISCFKIRTCFGADISSISQSPTEAEVLIPPFEKFKIVSVKKRKKNCNVLYTLQSTGTQSNMNCELLKNNS